MSKKRVAQERERQFPHQDRQGRVSPSWLHIALLYREREELCLVTPPQIFVQDRRDTVNLWD